MSHLVSPEEAVLVRAARDAVVFVDDSKSNRADRLWKRSRERVSDDSGVEIADDLRPLYPKVFGAAVDALIQWDFQTNFEHNR